MKGSIKLRKLPRALLVSLSLLISGAAAAESVANTDWVDQIAPLWPIDQDNVKKRYEQYLSGVGNTDFHLAVSQDGATWSAAWHEKSDKLTPADVRRMVLQRCQFVARMNCFIAAIDGILQAPMTPPFPLEEQAFQFGGAIDPVVIPFLGAVDRDDIAAHYPQAKEHKALAISRVGTFGYALEAASGEAAEQEALESCGRDECFIYAVDNLVMFSPDTNILRGPPRPTAESGPIIASVRNRVIYDLRDLIIGNPEGNITLTVFFDYQCLPCKNVHRTILELTRIDPQLRVVFKEYPILGPESVIAAKAAIAAARQGKYEAFHDALIGSHGTLSEAKIFRLADSMGLDIDRLEKDMATPTIEDHLRDVSSLADEIAVGSTPTFVVGDLKIAGGLDIDSLKKMIAEARKTCTGMC